MTFSGDSAIVYLSDLLTPGLSGKGPFRYVDVSLLTQLGYGAVSTAGRILAVGQLDFDALKDEF